VGRSSGTGRPQVVSFSLYAAHDLSEQRLGRIATPLVLFIGQIWHRAEPAGLRSCSDDARTGDGRSRFLCRDDPHWNDNRGLALWWALPAVISVNDDWRFGGHGQESKWLAAVRKAPLARLTPGNAASQRKTPPKAGRYGGAVIRFRSRAVCERGNSNDSRFVRSWLRATHDWRDTSLGHALRILASNTSSETPLNGAARGVTVSHRSPARSARKRKRAFSSSSTTIIDSLMIQSESARAFPPCSIS
jgi:hypothetical protein